jgi:hypothetical protein
MLTHSPRMMDFCGLYGGWAKNQMGWDALTAQAETGLGINENSKTTSTTDDHPVGYARF